MATPRASEVALFFARRFLDIEDFEVHATDLVPEGVAPRGADGRVQGRRKRVCPSPRHQRGGTGSHLKTLRYGIEIETVGLNRERLARAVHWPALQARRISGLNIPKKLPPASPLGEQD